MAKVRPFRSVHYSDKMSDQLDQLITPPYDVISPAGQEQFYKAHPANIIRLVLGKQYATDSAADNRYTRAAAILAEWLQEGTLVHDAHPSLVVYRMEFELPDGGKDALDGIVALVEVDEYGQGRVLPHEKTYKGPKQDQLQLLRACKAHFTPVHVLYHDEPGEVIALYKSLMEQQPDFQAKEADGAVHKMWVISDEDVIRSFQETMAPKTLFIADGHHRYETALAYKKEMEYYGQSVEDDGHGHVMMYLTSMSHPGLTILPAHRMVKGLPTIDAAEIDKALAPYFDVERLCFTDSDKEAVSAKLLERIRSYSNVGGKFGMVVHGEDCFRLLRLRDFSLIDPLMDKSIPSSLRGLDVTILREVIMTRGLGMDMENSEGHVEYTPNVAEALSKALRGEVQVSFILNSTRVDQMRIAAELGHKLPHKSTYFFPKICSGMVMNVFDR